MSASATVDSRVGAAPARPCAARASSGRGAGSKHDLVFGKPSFGWRGNHRRTPTNPRPWRVRLAPSRAFADDRPRLDPAGVSSNAGPVSAINPNPLSTAFAAHLASVTNPTELEKLLNLLPPRIADVLKKHPRRLSLLEVVLDLGRTPIARFADGDEQIDQRSLSYEDIASALGGVGDVGGDNRAGVNETYAPVFCLLCFTKSRLHVCRLSRVITHTHGPKD
jgi:hypothetical protein